MVNRLTDNPAPAATPLTDQALAQLRKAAEGNGLTAADITLLKTDEKVYTLEAEMGLRLVSDLESKTYSGTPRKGITLLASRAALDEEVNERKREAQANPAPIFEAALRDIKAQPNEGWGLEDAKVILPEKSVTLAAKENCPICHGGKSVPCPTCQAQGFVQCPQCRQRPGEEFCYMCGGRGVNPSNPNDRCTECRGTGWAPCRMCAKSGFQRGFIPCHHCNSKRSLPCHQCNGVGFFCNEVKIVFAAETEFRIRTGGLPSILNRTMERLGLINLGKGHADIETYTPTEDEDFKLNEERRKTDLPPVLYYRARVPFAEVKASIMGKPAVVTAFGKRAIIVSAPFFLDNALELARGNLARAAQGTATLESAMQARAIRDAVNLQLANQSTVKDFRRLYPFGISPDTMKEIVGNTRRALSRATFKIRGVLAAIIVGIMGAGVAYAVLTPLHQNLTLSFPPKTALLADIGALLGMEIIGWLGFRLAAHFVLKRKFPTQKHAVIPKIGKTGMAMLVGILAVWGAGIFLAKPLWLHGISF